MARVSAPLLSLDASGTLAKAITFSKWKGRNYVRTRVVPSNPRSGLQVGMRAGIAGAPDLWNNYLSPAHRAAWATGVGAEAISGYNLYCRQGQINLRSNYGPAVQYPSTAHEQTPVAPAGPAAVQDGTDMSITWTDAIAADAYLIFHGLTTGFSSNISSLVAVVKSGLQVWAHRNPVVGTHYYDIRSCGNDGGVGALAGEFIGVIA